MAVWIAAALLTLAAALFVAAPLTEVFSLRPERRKRESEVMQLEHEHRLALAGIRELDFDHAMGKIGDAEYNALRGQLETRALTAMTSLSHLTGPASSVEVRRIAKSA